MLNSTHHLSLSPNYSVITCYPLYQFLLTSFLFRLILFLFHKPITHHYSISYLPPKSDQFPLYLSCLILYKPSTQKHCLHSLQSLLMSQNTQIHISEPTSKLHLRSLLFYHQDLFYFPPWRFQFCRRHIPKSHCTIW